MQKHFFSTDFERHHPGHIRHRHLPTRTHMNRIGRKDLQHLSPIDLQVKDGRADGIHDDHLAAGSRRKVRVDDDCSLQQLGEDVKCLRPRPGTRPRFRWATARESKICDLLGYEWPEVHRKVLDGVDMSFRVYGPDLARLGADHDGDKLGPLSGHDNRTP